MNLLRLTAKPSSPDVSAKRPAARQRAVPQSIFGYSRQATRALTAALLAAALAGGTGAPAFAQDPGQSPPASQQEQRPELPTPQSPEQNRPNQDPNAPTQQPAPVYGPGPDESADSRVVGRLENITIRTRRSRFPICSRRIAGSKFRNSTLRTEGALSN